MLLGGRSKRGRQGLQGVAMTKQGRRQRLDVHEMASIPVDFQFALPRPPWRVLFPGRSKLDHRRLGSQVLDPNARTVAIPAQNEAVTAPLAVSRRTVTDGDTREVKRQI